MSLIDMEELLINMAASSGNWLQNLFDFGKNIEERRYNEAQIDKARQWAVDMWKMQNEYNSPLQQRKRLEAAGINPNLAFGSSASAMGGSVGSVPGANTDTVNARRMQQRMNAAEIAAINEQIRKERNNNNLFEYLIEDRKRHDKMELESKMLEYQWNLANKTKMMDADLYSKMLHNQHEQTRIDLDDAYKELAIAQKKHEDKKVDELKQRIAHLKNQYAFEDNYYRRGLNPYETSTAAGLLRTLNGLASFSSKNPKSFINQVFKIPQFGLPLMLYRLYKQRKSK